MPSRAVVKNAISRPELDQIAPPFIDLPSVRRRAGGISRALVIDLRVAVARGVALVEEGVAARIRRERGLRDRLAQEGDLAPLAERTIDEVKLIGLAEARDDEKLALRRKTQRSRLARTQIRVQRFGGIRRAVRNPVVD